jgi:hypothetical protein
MVVALTDTAAAVARYAGRLHRVAGEGHHVASPLGAWLLLALCGPASSGEARDQLAEAVGCDLDQAAAMAGALLCAPHPAVAAAAGVWPRGDMSGGPLGRWLAGLPRAVATGALADQAALDDWARRSTGGMIREFPADLSPQVPLVLASALATKVSWEEPFDVVPGAALGPYSRWANQLSRVLRTPQDWLMGTPQGWGHGQFIAATDQAGDAAVHTAWGCGGLLVASVAAQSGVPAADVLAAAYRLAAAIATGGEVVRRSLFALPLGPAPLWEITERPAWVEAGDGREEQCTAVLPAWSAASVHDLTRDAGLGFSAAAATLAELMNLDPSWYQARQAAVARYSRTGFEAAAVTAAFAGGVHDQRRGLLRTAELRFGHPFAVVAVTAGKPFTHDAGTVDQQDAPRRSPWQGLPVFAAWITQPEDADNPA